MTTPRDDIAGLIERLRVRDIRNAVLMVPAAATQLDALSERAHYAEGTADLAMKHRDEAEARADALSARVKELEREKDHYLSNWKEAATYCNIETRHAEQAEAERDATVARAIRAEQERDEAYERLIDIDRIVHVPTPGKETAAHHFQRDFDAIRAITRPYRSLASGPEKEKKE